MNTIPAQDIKRRGLAAVDDVIGRGDVHVIRNNQPQYVVMSEDRYQALVAAEREAYYGRVKESLTDVKAGRVKKFKNAADLLKAIESRGDE